MGSLGVVDGRRRRDGHWRLVHALHRDAGLPPAGPGGLRLADRAAVAPGRYYLFDLRTLCSESAENGLGAGSDVRCYSGRRHRGSPLHRHGCHALGCRMPV